MKIENKKKYKKSKSEWENEERVPPFGSVNYYAFHYEIFNINLFFSV